MKIEGIITAMISECPFKSRHIAKKKYIIFSLPHIFYPASVDTTILQPTIAVFPCDLGTSWWMCQHHSHLQDVQCGLYHHLNLSSSLIDMVLTDGGFYLIMGCLSSTVPPSSIWMTFSGTIIGGPIFFFFFFHFSCFVLIFLFCPLRFVLFICTLLWACFCCCLGMKWGMKWLISYFVIFWHY